MPWIREENILYYFLIEDKIIENYESKILPKE